MTDDIRPMGKTRENEVAQCKNCFHWQVEKGKGKCALSGKNRLGMLGACQYLDSRSVNALN